VTPDGQFGPVTARAVMVVQQRYGLAPDGVVSGATWRAVFAQAPR
jgi:peptidoglycan hydrolase-like protein with peptidoglycan-binding domain